MVDSCSEWDASNPEEKFARGCARSITTTFFPEGRIKPNQAKRPETHIFHWEIWSTFQEIPFSPFGETKSILTVTFHPKFPFLSVNWKQPLFFQENLLALSRLITIIKLIWVVCCIPERSKSRHMLKFYLKRPISLRIFAD